MHESTPSFRFSERAAISVLGTKPTLHGGPPIVCFWGEVEVRDRVAWNALVANDPEQAFAEFTRCTGYAAR
jgi:hypothetical protein